MTVTMRDVESPEGLNLHSSATALTGALSAGLDVAGRSIYWVPVGHAAAVLVGDFHPSFIALPVLALLAVVHHKVPAALSVTVGAGALLGGLPSVVGATYDTGYPIPVLLAAYGGIVTTAAFVCAIGGGGSHRVARYLVVGLAAMELALFALSPIGRVPDGTSPATAVAAVLVVVTVAAVRSEPGYYTMATFLMATQFVLAATGSPYGHSGPLLFAGTMVFALTRTLLARR